MKGSKASNSKKRIIISSLIALFLLAIPFLLLVCVELFIPDQYINTFTAELPEKVHLLDSITEPKVVVIGSSSVAFALDSQLLSEKVQMPVVNFGLYASLGTRVMTELSKPSINKGDIIILSPETDSQTMSMYFGAETMWQATETDRSIINRLPADMKKEMALCYWDYSSNKCRLWMKGTPDPEGVYRKDSFNKYGDVIYDRPMSKMKLGYDASKIITPSPEIISSEFIKYLNDYIKYAKEKGASVYFTFAPMNKAALNKSVDRNDLYKYYLYLSSVLDCEIISDITGSIMDAGFFYDSNFHLNDSGKTVWTAKLALDILRTSGKAVNIGIELPKSPQLPSDIGRIEDDGNDVFFTFREVRNDRGEIQWYSVSGLSDEGKNKTELTIPSSHHKIPVHSIDKNAFSSSNLLKSITVCDNIYSIESGAFANVPTLTELHIFNEDESTMTVDQITLFDGANNDLKIYLYSEKSYESYVTGYFWANYGNRMILK